LPEVADFEPYDPVDACSKIHDLDYQRAKQEPDPEKRALLIREADERAVKCYDKFKDVQPIQSIARAGIHGKLTVEKLISALKGKPTVLYGGRLGDKIVLVYD
jgi:hypothetical protein